LTLLVNARVVQSILCQIKRFVFLMKLLRLSQKALLEVAELLIFLFLYVCYIHDIEENNDA